MCEARTLITAVETPHGPIDMIQHMEIVHENGQPILLEACRPLAFIWHCFQTCDAWYALLQKRLQLNPPTEDDPWSLILYTDEVTPGNGDGCSSTCL